MSTPSSVLQSLFNDVLETQDRISSVRDRLGGTRRPLADTSNKANAADDGTTSLTKPRPLRSYEEEISSLKQQLQDARAELDGSSTSTALQTELKKTKALLEVTQMGLAAAEETSREILRRYEAEVGALQRREKLVQVEALCVSCERQHTALLSAQGYVALLQYESEEHKVQQAMRDLECF